MNGFNVTNAGGESVVFIPESLAACSEVFMEMMQTANDDQQPVSYLDSGDY